MSKDAKWLIGVMVAIGIALGGTVWRTSLDVTSKLTSTGSAVETHSHELEKLNGNLSKVSEAITVLVAGDVSDIKSRLKLIETREMYPATLAEFRKVNDTMTTLEKRIRETEIAIEKK